MTDLLIIGGGAAGLMAAGAACARGLTTAVVEHNPKGPGQKLLITGKGRCNVTNDCDVREFLNYVRHNPRFLYSALYAFSPASAMELFESLGVPLKTERGRYGIVGVLSRLGIQEHSIISLLNPRGLLQIGRNVLLMAGHRGEARHHVQQTIEKARPDEPSVRYAGWVLRVDHFGTLGRHAPVTVNVLDDDVVLDQTLVGIVDPLLHRRIVLADRLFVAVLVVQHIDDAQVDRKSVV